MTDTTLRIALIGFGEAGGILGQDLVAQGLHVSAYDRLGEPLRAKATATGVTLCASAAEAVAGADLIFSAVTAGSALGVAQQVALLMTPEQVFIDINSVAPNTKRSACAAVQSAGASYVDAAVMAPVPPQRLQTPILLGGEKAEQVRACLAPLGFNVRVVAEDIGVASAIKMCRSVMIKGLEALTTECLSTARQYGAEDAVLASLHKSFPSMGWDADLPHYLISRVAEHGRRRAEEMEEVAKTAADVGVAPHMSQAIVATQRGLVERMAQQGMTYADTLPFDWTRLVDTLKD
jgi:3-hydroxyisobutyrate dehydrogenase-like beta-hydroxyacid dehydrogenase